MGTSHHSETATNDFGPLNFLYQFGYDVSMGLVPEKGEERLKNLLRSVFRFNGSEIHEHTFIQDTMGSTETKKGVSAVFTSIGFFFLLLMIILLLVRVKWLRCGGKRDQKSEASPIWLIVGILLLFVSFIPLFLSTLAFAESVDITYKVITQNASKIVDKFFEDTEHITNASTRILRELDQRLSKTFRDHLSKLNRTTERIFVDFEKAPGIIPYTNKENKMRKLIEDYANYGYWFQKMYTQLDWDIEMHEWRLRRAAGKTRVNTTIHDYPEVTVETADIRRKKQVQERDLWRIIRDRVGESYYTLREYRTKEHNKDRVFNEGQLERIKQRILQINNNLVEMMRMEIEKVRKAITTTKSKIQPIFKSTAEAIKMLEIYTKNTETHLKRSTKRFKEAAGTFEIVNNFLYVSRMRVVSLLSLPRLSKQIHNALYYKNDYRSTTKSMFFVLGLVPTFSILSFIAIAVAGGVCRLKNRTTVAYKRSVLSNRTAKLLSIGAYCTLVCGAMTMMWATFVFDSGLVISSVCKPLFHDPEFEVLQVFSKEENLLNDSRGKVTFKVLNLGRILKQCQNSSIFSAISGHLVDRDFLLQNSSLEEYHHSIQATLDALDVEMPELHTLAEDLKAIHHRFMSESFDVLKVFHILPETNKLYRWLDGRYVYVERKGKPPFDYWDDYTDNVVRYTVHNVVLEFERVQKYAKMVRRELPEHTKTVIKLDTFMREKAKSLLKEEFGKFFEKFYRSLQQSLETVSNLSDQTGTPCDDVLMGYRNLGVLICDKIGRPVYGIWVTLTVAGLFSLPSAVGMFLVERWLRRMDFELEEQKTQCETPPRRNTKTVTPVKSQMSVETRSGSKPFSGYGTPSTPCSKPLPAYGTPPTPCPSRALETLDD